MLQADEDSDQAERKHDDTGDSSVSNSSSSSSINGNDSINGNSNIHDNSDTNNITDIHHDSSSNNSSSSMEHRGGLIQERQPVKACSGNLNSAIHVTVTPRELPVVTGAVPSGDENYEGDSTAAEIDASSVLASLFLSSPSSSSVSRAENEG